MTAKIEARNEVYEKMNKFLKKVITKKCGTHDRKYWLGNIKYNPIIMQSIAEQSTYNSIKQYINVDKKITDKNKDFPVYLTSSSEDLVLSIFRYRVPRDFNSEPDNDHTLGCYEVQEIYKGDLVNYTIDKDFLGTLNDVNLDELHKNKNKWSDIQFGDKDKQGTTNVVPTKDISNVNHFTHKKHTLLLVCNWPWLVPYG